MYTDEDYERESRRQQELYRQRREEELREELYEIQRMYEEHQREQYERAYYEEMLKHEARIYEMVNLLDCITAKILEYA